MKIVLDTNIWVSGLLLPKSNAGKLISEWRSFKINLVTSDPILDEIKKVLLYPKIKKRIQWNETRIDQYLLLIKFFTYFISIDNTPNNIIVKRDENDSAILQTLIISKADYLITGDQDLLELKETYSIITLAEFYENVV